MKRFRVMLVVVIVLAMSVVLSASVRQMVGGWITHLRGRKTVEDRLGQYGAGARSRLKPGFADKNVEYPPSAVVMVGVKSERVLHLYARDEGKWRFIKSYPVLACGRRLGPKLEHGDGMTPEGIYRISFLNANSLYHLSMRLDYPNKFDRAMGRRDGRRNLGTDIMIHGNEASIGCLAMGDEAIEDLFVLAADTGTRNVKVILSPVDFRNKRLPSDLPELPSWTHALYRKIKAELNRLPVPDETSRRSVGQASNGGSYE